MHKKMIFIENSGFWGGSSHEIIDSETEETLFVASDLSECPEDAIIGRDLFDGYDYIKAVRYGLSLAEQGYTGIDIDFVQE